MQDYDPNGGGCVDIEILSYSQPNKHSMMGRIIYPIIRPLQHSFFISQMKYLQSIATAVTPAIERNDNMMQ
jgi:hypothetical protein